MYDELITLVKEFIKLSAINEEILDMSMKKINDNDLETSKELLGIAIRIREFDSNCMDSIQRMKEIAAQS